MSRRPGQEQNNERNQYIPNFIAAKPFYVGDETTDADYLEHQRSKAEPKDTLDKAKWYDRGRKLGPAATKYRKGACENCGAMTHKTKDCLSRPRKHGAKWTGKDIQADEMLDNVKLGWDAKRDRWNGYDSREYTAVVKEFEEMEKLRQQAGSTSEQKSEEEDESKDDETRYAEETDMGRSQPTSTRQLRLREDTAKYLINLDLDSARYDPKTRTMDTASQSINNGQADSVAEEGFVRPSNISDESGAFERAQKYAWETQESNISSNPNSRKLHLQANPTEGELLLKRRTEEQSQKKAAQRKLFLEKYGTAPPESSSNGSSKTKSIPVTASEAYVEYDEQGLPKAAFARLKSKARSKYPEDVLLNNHTSVWGSWWSDFTWGYACCHSTTKNSYCTGEAGRIAFEEAQNLRTGQTLQITDDAHDDEEARKTDLDRVEHVDPETAQKLQQEQQGDDIEFRKDEADADTTRSHTSNVRDRKGVKRSFGDVTEDEIEAYKRNKTAAADPMRQFGHLQPGEVL